MIPLTFTIIYGGISQPLLHWTTAAAGATPHLPPLSLLRRVVRPPLHVPAEKDPSNGSRSDVAIRKNPFIPLHEHFISLFSTLYEVIGLHFTWQSHLPNSTAPSHGLKHLFFSAVWLLDHCFRRGPRMKSHMNQAAGCLSHTKIPQVAGCHLHILSHAPNIMRWTQGHLFYMVDSLAKYSMKLLNSRL